MRIFQGGGCRVQSFLNNEMHKRARKNFMEEALPARMRRYAMKFFRVILCLFVVKKLSPSFTDVLL